MQAHFVHLSKRDEALARSLNADYVAQVSTRLHLMIISIYYITCLQACTIAIESFAYGHL